MIRVGFIGSVSKEWMGGLNYFKNLLFALNSIEDKKIDVYIFVGKKTDQKIKNMFNSYGQVIEDSMFDRKSLKWFFMKIEQKIFGTNFLLINLLKKYNIKVLSHTSILNLKGIKTINWIPDFQHIHLAQMFSQEEVNNRDQIFMEIIKKSDSIILSSFDALKDFKKFAPKYESKVKVLQFVSQPDRGYFELDENDQVRLLEKYELPSEFFYIPNQFWKHKNHILVFKVINELKKEGIEISLVCTGYLNDFRNKAYIDEVHNFIRINKLEKNIRLLGLVDYEEVFGLIKYSKAVINPSLFEGWSSTVEECKSVGKNMILSDLDVHKEQYPNATFFDKNNVNSLKNILKNYNFKKEILGGRNDLDYRTQKFAQNYEDIVIEVLG